MYHALMKRQLTRPSAFHITRLGLTRASLHGKAQHDIKGNEEFFVNTTFPDDYEGSRMKADLEKKATADEGTTEQHKADIYDSLWGKEASGSPTRNRPERTARDEALETEHEPEIDEM